MAENKQYITQEQENGKVLISEEVIATIAAQAIGEVDGVNAIGGKPGADLAELIAKKNWGKGIKIAISQEETISIDCNIIVTYGNSVVTVATAVQDAITNAISSMTGVTVASVNVNVCGIARQ